MTKQTIAMAILAVLLVAPECLSKTITVSVNWDQARAIWDHGEFRQSVKIVLRSSKRVRGTLAGITDSGMRIQKRQSETVIPRDQIRVIRLVPRRASTWNNRVLAIAGGVPAGYLATYGTIALCCGGDPDSTSFIALVLGVWGTTQYLLYRLGAKADRGVLILLIPATASATANSDLDTPPTPPEGRPYTEEGRL